MKKTFIFGLMAAALGFTACSSEDDAVLGEKIQKKGMVLNATVEQPAETRATIDDTNPTWQFAFAAGDKVSVTNSSYSGYYTFEKKSTNFASEDAEVSETPVTWYAYYPSEEIDLTNQDGTLTGVAGKFAMAGATASEVKGDEALSIIMNPKVAIIKIDNRKGNIDIRVKSTGDYLVALTAPSNDVDFILNISEDPTSFLTATEKGIYYIVVPANSSVSCPLDIYDGDVLVKHTYGLTAGKYYELTIPDPDPNLLPGIFSVSATKQVQFAKSNLYWNGSAFKFEAKQTDYPTTWDASHVGHFYWATSQETSYDDASFTVFGATTSDVPFFAESVGGLTVDGTSGLFALSQSEWIYLLKERTNAGDLKKIKVKIGSTENCLIIAPDDFSGTLESTYITLEDVNALGLVCLPPNGILSNSNIVSGTSGSYWSSSPHSSEYADASSLYFNKILFNVGWFSRGERHGLRLVK